jgi:hypothetical protein
MESALEKMTSSTSRRFLILTTKKEKNYFVVSNMNFVEFKFFAFFEISNDSCPCRPIIIIAAS